MSSAQGRPEPTSPGHASMLAVFNEVHRHAPISRLRIAASAGLSAAAVSRISRRLVDIGVIEEEKPRPSPRPGRREVDLTVRGDGVLVGGISINAFEQWVALANLRGEVMERRPLSPRNLADVASTIDDAARAIKALIRGLACRGRRLLGVGLACAGVIDPERGVVTTAPTLGWSGADVGARLGRHLGVPIVIEGIANALATAEHQFGIARDCNTLILLNATLGIGSALIADGRLLRGSACRAGFIGQLPLAPPLAPSFSTLDAIAGGAALARQQLPAARRRSSPRPHDRRLLERLMQKAARGEPRSIAACQGGAVTLAAVAAQLTTALGAEAILLAGPLAGIPAYRAAFAEHAHGLLARGSNTPRIIDCEKSVIEAACLLAIRELVSVRGLHLRRAPMQTTSR